MKDASGHCIIVSCIRRARELIHLLARHECRHQDVDISCEDSRNYEISQPKESLMSDGIADRS